VDDRRRGVRDFLLAIVLALVAGGLSLAHGSPPSPFRNLAGVGSRLFHGLRRPFTSWTEVATVSFEANEGKWEPQC
jgi:hypothetical protein